jgi:hypothetical protein
MNMGDFREFIEIETEVKSNFIKKGNNVYELKKRVSTQ